MATPNTKDQGRFDFFKIAPLMGGISLVAVIISLGLILTKGLNFGVDFAGGTEMQVQFASKVDTQAIEKEVSAAGFSNAVVQSFGENNEYLIRAGAFSGTDERQSNNKLTAAIEQLRKSLTEKFQLPAGGIRRVDTVGPQVGNELKRNGLLAAFYSFIVILIYVAMRFDYMYAPGAVLCLVHDCIVTLGVFSLLGREVNVQIMASILTLIGYSLNDTIVTYDRIRETLPHHRERGLRFVINRSINDMLGRSVLTSFTTLLAVFGLLIFGGGVIADIAFTLAIGIIVGTYSSIYVAAPLIMVVNKIKPAGGAKAIR
jgi:preprotein translocase subunit SecF